MNRATDFHIFQNKTKKSTIHIRSTAPITMRQENKRDLKFSQLEVEEQK